MGKGLIVALAGALALGAAQPRVTGRAAAPPRPRDPLAAALQPGPADTLAGVLRRLEGGPRGGEASFQLGLLHFARGEYLAARQAFARAYPRLEEPARGEARYWVGMAWLALGDARKARLAVKPLLEGASALREPACLLAAQSYELERQPVPAMALYERLLREPRPDPVVLARAAALQQRMGRADRAAQLAQRLLELYPRSAEAASARRAEAVAAATSDVRGGVAVQIGAFADAAKARELAERARRAGYPHAQVIVLGRADGQSHVVRLGVYATRAEATAAGVRAERALGTDYWLVTLQ